VDIFVALIDIQDRHLLAHPNLTLPTLFKKVLLVAKALEETASDTVQADINLFVKMFVSTLGVTDFDKHSAAWRAEQLDDDWDAYDEHRVQRYRRVLEEGDGEAEGDGSE
jgi:hypothetical protein